MSRLAEYRKLEQQLAAQLAKLESMKSDSGLKQEMEFESKLRALLGEYGYSLREVINLLDPQAHRRGHTVEQKAGSRKPRQIKTYKNPNTGEIVETKGGNHKLLKEWKVKHGAATVESWSSK